MRNPFKPTAGAPPPLLVGRQDILDEFQESIEDGSGSPGLLQLFSGTRGVGKTVMLDALGRTAASHGWIVIHETATTGMMERIAQRARYEIDHFGSATRKSQKHISGITFPHVVGGGGITWAHKESAQPAWRQEVSSLLDLLERHGAGLVITVDEIHAKADEEMRQLTTQIQHLIREQREISLLMAGLPKAVHDILSGEVTSFMRRASRHDLGSVPISEVSESFKEIINHGGRSISDDLADRCAEATSGYPFMIQLVGYHVWRLSKSGPITSTDVAQGIDAAKVRLGNLVHAPALNDLSDIDRSFLVHMAADDGPSRTSEIGKRMDRDSKYANVYRTRLISAGLIRTAGNGLVDFEAPYMREYLREHATHLIAGTPHE